MQYQKFLKNTIFLLANLLLVLTIGCTDESNIFNTEKDNTNIRIKLVIPDYEEINTRSSETAVNDLTIFLFGSDKTTLYEKKEYSNISDGSIIELSKPSNPDNGNLIIYAIANTKSNNISIEENLSLNNIQQTVITNSLDQINGTVLSGITSPTNKSDNNIEIELHRIFAKVSVKFENIKDYEFSGFGIFNINTQGYLGAPTNPDYQFFEGSKEDINIKEINELSLYPSKGLLSSDSGEEAFVILKAKSKSDRYCYYRLDFINDGTKLDILPNHHYQFIITNITEAGYDSPEEAAKHPESDKVKYSLHDHSKNVFSMISDGVHELGVSNNLSLKDPENGVKLSTVEFKVRLACVADGRNCSDIPSFENIDLTSTPTLHQVTEKYKVEIISGGEWLSLKSVTLSTENETSNNGNETESETDGKIWKYTLNINRENGIGGEMEAIIRVTWLGLSRDIKVTYSSEFDPSEICQVQLTIYEDGIKANNNIITDYWIFLSESGEYSGAYSVGDTEGDTPILYGVHGVGNKIRNQGFHFPMPYGNDSNNYWEYVYDINFEKLDYKYRQNIWEIKVETEGDTFFDLNNIDWNIEDNVKVKLKLKDNINNYKYAIGTITFKIIFFDYPPQDIKFDLYHTGFFFFNKEKISFNEGKYYYYEVIELEPGQYWLDRNISAKSNGLYIEDETGSIFPQNSVYPFSFSDAKGDLVTIAKANSNNTLNLPTLDPNNICPPGYRIPTKEEFDKVRHSSRFHNEERKQGAVTYFTSYYNSEVGPIYFPKSRFLNNGNVAGDSRAGYYWTQTSAAGLEKEEIGKWLKVFYLSGNSTSYVNGNISNHKMSLRCIAKNGDETDGRVSETQHTIGFKVKGATGVYLYTENVNPVTNEVSRNGIFSFPGKAIGDYKTVESCNNDLLSKFLQFSYTSTTPVEDLYVYFTYTDENGKIWIICNDENDYTHENKPDGDGFTKPAKLIPASEVKGDIKGWPVWVDYCYTFLWDFNEKTLTKTHIYKNQGTPDDDNARKEITPPDKFNSGDKIQIKWYNKYDNISHPYLYSWDEKGNPITSAYPGFNTNNENKEVYNSTELNINSENSYIWVLVNNNQDFTKIRYQIFPGKVDYKFDSNEKDQGKNNNNNDLDEGNFMEKTIKCYQSSDGRHYEYEVILW